MIENLGKPLTDIFSVIVLQWITDSAWGVHIFSISLGQSTAWPSLVSKGRQLLLKILQVLQISRKSFERLGTKTIVNSGMKEI